MVLFVKGLLGTQIPYLCITLLHHIEMTCTFTHVCRTAGEWQRPLPSEKYSNVCLGPAHTLSVTVCTLIPIVRGSAGAEETVCLSPSTLHTGKQTSVAPKLPLRFRLGPFLLLSPYCIEHCPHF